MKKRIEIKTAELAAGNNEDIIMTGSIGSCLAVVLYDKINKVGGMAHVFLPKKINVKQKTPKDSPAKYVDEGIESLLQETIKAGAKQENLVAKLIGGSKMFKVLSENGIGEKNILSAHKTLAKLKIPIMHEDTGGTIGRIAEFNINTGIVTVTTKM